MGVRRRERLRIEAAWRVLRCLEQNLEHIEGGKWPADHRSPAESVPCQCPSSPHHCPVQALILCLPSMCQFLLTIFSFSQHLLSTYCIREPVYPAEGPVVDNTEQGGVSIWEEGADWILTLGSTDQR